MTVSTYRLEIAEEQMQTLLDHQPVSHDPRLRAAEPDAKDAAWLLSAGVAQYEEALIWYTLTAQRVQTTGDDRIDQLAFELEFSSDSALPSGLQIVCCIGKSRGSARAAPKGMLRWQAVVTDVMDARRKKVLPVVLSLELD
jgi:hypothetical protein